MNPRKAVHLLLVSCFVLASILSAAQPTLAAGLQPLQSQPQQEATPASTDLSTAQQAIGAAWSKFLEIEGPRYADGSLTVTADADWAYGQVTWPPSSASELESLAILGHRMSNGDWQAVLPDDVEVFQQWLEAMPESLIPPSQKEFLRGQAAESTAAATEPLPEEAATDTETAEVYQPRVFLPLVEAGVTAQAAAADTNDKPKADRIVLVGFKPSATPNDRALAHASVNAEFVEPLSPLTPQAEKVKIGRGLTVEKAIEKLAKNPHVDYAEPDYLVELAEASNDPYYLGGSLWGMYGNMTSPANEYGSQAGEAWAAGRVGSMSTYIGVIDEGIQYAHEDLAGRVWVNPYDPVDGVDNDGNGYVDDQRGWDFFHNDRTVFDAGDGDDHGTHVAGTIGGRGGNGIGIAGVNWHVKLISAKFLGPDGGWTSDAVRAVDYLTDLKLRHGIKIVATSNSWGGGGYSQSLIDAINRGGDAGILFVAAAGNGSSNNNVSPFYPSNYQCTRRFDNKQARGWDCLASVAAIDSWGALAWFSNYGSTAVDLGAPGVDVVSTLPSNSYGFKSGTSMATPHVSGAAALCASINPALTAPQIRQAILNSTAPTGSLVGKTVTGGRLDIGSMIGRCPVPAPFSDNMESGLKGWTATGLWHQVDSSSPYPNSWSGTRSWWYGQDGTGTYDTGSQNAGSLTSPAVYIPTAGYYLRFYDWYQTEAQAETWDQRWVQISVDGGAFDNVMQLSHTDMNTWFESRAVDLTEYAGHTVQVRFQFDTQNEFFNAFQGWYIDDVGISTTPPPSCSDVYEPNDYAEQARSIGYGEVRSGDICPIGDVDFFSFYGSEGDSITVDIDARVNGSSLDSVVYLLDSDGVTVLALNDDYTGLDSRLEVALPHSGTFYLKVREFSQSYEGGPDYTYDLSLHTDDLIFADDFETGDLSRWSASRTDGGDLSVTNAAVFNGSYGMQANIDDNQSIYVTDETPVAEPRYRAFFFISPNNIAMANNDSHILLYGYSGSTAVLRIDFRRYSGLYQMRAGLLNDATTWRLTGFVTLNGGTSEWNMIEIDWRGARAVGAHNGSLTLWKDGELRSNLTGIDNDTRRVDSVRLGSVSGIDSGTRGVYYLDSFESRRHNYIGPWLILTAAVRAAMDPLSNGGVDTTFTEEEAQPQEDVEDELTRPLFLPLIRE